MFNQGGLSLEQAPPISVVLKFFITASIFGLILGLYLIGDTTHLLSQNEYAFDITVIHLLALGIMASFMFGALFQMLPVLAGVVIKLPREKSNITHIILIIGLIFQLLAFNTSIPYLYPLSALILGGGLLHAAALMIRGLIKVPDHSNSSKGMLFALGSFMIAILLGIYLLLTLGNYIEGSLFANLKEAHYSFALFGWVTLLIISVSFQVVEMFYVTPKYPNIISRYLIITIFTLLVFKLIALLTNLPTIGINLFLALLFIGYASVTLHRLYQRRRPTSDATVWFWRLGMSLLILSMISYTIGMLTQLEEISFALLSYIGFIGFALSIVFAMIYKIVPFLVWFHLSNQGYLEAPMMHDVIHPKKAKIHFGIHSAMIIAWGISMLWDTPPIAILAALLTTLSFGWILYHLILAWRKYNHTQKHSKKFEW